MKKTILTFSVLASFLVFSCEENKDSGVISTDEANKAIENTSAEKLINNPTTVNNPNQEVTSDGAIAVMEMEEKEFDFGTITEGDKVSHVFAFTNTGENPLIIANAKGSCGCTVPEYPKGPIAPGAKGEILVTFNSKGKVGQQRKSVTIVANTNPATTQFFITSTVLKATGAPLAE